MSNVVEMFPDDSGYITSDKGVEGVYNKDLAAWNRDGEVVVGQKANGGIDNPTYLTVESMNRFCIMWLAIFDPDVLKCDE